MTGCEFHIAVQSQLGVENRGTVGQGRYLGKHGIHLQTRQIVHRNIAGGARNLLGKMAEDPLLVKRVAHNGNAPQAGHHGVRNVHHVRESQVHESARDIAAKFQSRNCLLVDEAKNHGCAAPKVLPVTRITNSRDLAPIATITPIGSPWYLIRR